MRSSGQRANLRHHSKLVRTPVAQLQTNTLGKYMNPFFPTGLLVLSLSFHIKRVHNPVALLRSFSGKYPWERYEAPYPPNYGLNSTPTVLLGEWLWHQITLQRLICQKQKNQTKPTIITGRTVWSLSLYHFWSVAVLSQVSVNYPCNTHKYSFMMYLWQGPPKLILPCRWNK